MLQRILEIAWLAVAILSLAAGVHKTWYHGFAHSYQFFLIFLLALVMYLNRRSQRKKNDPRN